jgi:acyl carrier protein
MTIDKNEIAGRVNKILAKEFEIQEDKLTLEANLYEDLGLDSLDSVDLVVALEKEFAFKISREQDEEKIRAIRTIEDVCGFIDSKQKSA